LANGQKAGKESGGTTQKGQQRDKAGEIKKRVNKMLWPLHATRCLPFHFGQKQMPNETATKTITANISKNFRK